MRIPLLTDNVLQRSYAPPRHLRKRPSTILSKVSVYIPRFTEIKRPFYQHGLGSECPEGHDEMGEVELGLQIQLDVHALLARLGLPPPLLFVFLEGRHDVLDAVAILIEPFPPGLPGVTGEALGVLLEVADDAVAGGHDLPTGGGCREVIGAANQQVAGCRVARALLTVGLPPALTTRIVN